MQGQTPTERRRPCEDTEREDGHVKNSPAASQGMPRTAGTQQKLKKRHRTDSPSELLKGNQLCQTLILDFWPLDT